MRLKNTKKLFDKHTNQPPIYGSVKCNSKESVRIFTQRSIVSKQFPSPDGPGWENRYYSCQITLDAQLATQECL